METYYSTERFGPDTIFKGEFLESVDVARPMRLVTEEFRSAKATNLVNRMLATDLKFTIADSDLPKVTRMCALAGVPVDYPLLDEQLVQFSLALPARLKVRGLQLRWFFRHALRDFLPRKVLTKKKHGFGLPFGLWLHQNAELREVCFDTLLALKRRRIFKPEFLERLIEMHGTVHASYYGVLIWVLVQLELWLETRGYRA
jgi:asparagine synthase (glutamine-hydrolysing)